MKTNTWHKGMGSCIDLILTNRKYFLENTTYYETGFSDHHHKILTTPKTTFQQEEPKCLIYRDHKNFTYENFKSDLQEFLQSCKGSYDAFDNYFTSSLNKHAPKKKKVFWGNGKPHINKNLMWAIMNRSKLKDKSNEAKQNS